MRYNLFSGKQIESTSLVYSIGVAFHAKERYWPNQVSCLHASDLINDESLLFPKGAALNGSILPPNLLLA